MLDAFNIKSVDDFGKLDAQGLLPWGRICDFGN